MNITFSIHFVRDKEAYSGTFATKDMDLDFLPFIGMKIHYDWIKSEVTDVEAGIDEERYIHVTLKPLPIDGGIWDKTIERLKTDGWGVKGN